VEYQKFFSFLGYNGENNAPTLGFVTRIGGLSVGAYYTGTAVDLGQIQTSSVNVTYDGTTGEENSRETYTGNDEPFVTTNNTLGILIGIGSIGINVGLQENLFGASEFKDEFYTGGTLFTNDIHQKYVQEFMDGSERGHSVSDFSWTTGTLTPVISVGTSLPLGSWELKPRLDLGFRFNFEGEAAPDDTGNGTGSFVYKEYRSANGEDIARTKTEYTADRLTMTPKFVLGADLDFAPGIGPSLVVKGGFDILGEDYGTTEKVTNYFENVNQTQVEETREDGYAEWSKMHFVVTPAYRYALSLGDRVELGLKGGLDFGFRNSNYKPEEYTITTDIYEYPNPADNYTETRREYSSWGDGQEETIFSITPGAVAAVQFTAIPNRLTLNAGVKFNLPGFTNTATKTTSIQDKTVIEIERADGSVVEYVSATDFDGESVSSTNNAWTAFSWNFGAGFSFLFNDTFSVDLAFSGGNTGRDFSNVDISDLAVLFTIRK
jgi:hypothetical protein